MNIKKGRDKSRFLNARMMVEDIIKCKWTLTVLEMVRQGINRPGAMIRQTPGLTTKVLNERLTKLQGFGVIERIVFPEKPPRVEYNLTRFGLKLDSVLEAIDRLQQDIDEACE